ncbi:hypothetical protein Tco_0669756, partial [Tanacetum coccineum]
ELVLPKYAVSIKKIRRIRAYTSPDATKDSSLIRRIHELLYAISKDYYTQRFWNISNVVLTPTKDSSLIRRIHELLYAVSINFYSGRYRTPYPTSVDTAVTPRLGGNMRRNIMDIITTQW